MHRILPASILLLTLSMPSMAMDNGVAVVTSAGSAGIQTGTEIRRDLMGECIVKLPAESQLVATNTSTDKFLHKIDGTDKDDYTQIWSSTIQLGWQVKQRFLYIVGAKGIGNAAAPQFHQDSAVVFRSEQIVSDPGDSQRFSEVSTRTRFFATAQDAEASARKRAVARLRDLQANACGEKGR
ncbi:MAG: hypothetical protein IPK50_14715 [Fibrobacterota bacterium]|nr:hypothetical protein [Fibrobacterota bacterium]QQS03547.1 MAG: hypothetical protein IPK50_14715 [Fibrobacterota bacterium]